MREIRLVLEMKTEKILKIAQEVSEDFLAKQEAHNKLLQKGERSYLGCRARKRANSVIIEWFHVGWAKKEDGSRYTKYIKRGRNHTYDVDKLATYAKPWEKDLVKQTEAFFGMLRKINRSLSLARMEIIKAHKAEKQAHLDFLDGAANISWKIKEMEERNWDEKK